MKKNLYVVLALVVIATACAKQQAQQTAETPVQTEAPIVTQQPYDPSAISFILKNSIGGDIYQLRVSPNEFEQFGEDILGKDIIKNGSSLAVSFRPEVLYENWDITVLTENGNTYTWRCMSLRNAAQAELFLGDEGEYSSVTPRE